MKKKGWRPQVDGMQFSTINVVNVEHLERVRD